MHDRISAAEALRRVPLFAGLDDDDLAALERMTLRQHFPRGHTIFRRGDPGDHAYVIVTGAVDLVIESQDGRELILARLGEGEHFGEMALMDDLQRSASARVASPSDMVVMPQVGFLQALADHPGISRQIIRTLVQRLRNADEKMESFAYLDAEGRIARMVLELEAGPDGHLQVSHEELAHMSATSRQTTTRVLGEWEEQGYVELSRRGIALNDREALVLMAEL